MYRKIYQNDWSGNFSLRENSPGATANVPTPGDATASPAPISSRSALAAVLTPTPWASASSMAEGSFGRSA